MNVTQFLKRLKSEVAPKYNARLEKGCIELRLKRRKKQVPTNRDFCAVTALVFEETGDFYSQSNYIFAGQELGMPYDLFEAIVRCNDNECEGATETKLRKQLLKIFGIKKEN